MKKKLNLLFPWLKVDYLVVTFSLFISVSILGVITFNLTIFDPIKKALSDFNFADLLYSKLSSTQETIDTNIVLVNIGHLDRSMIAEQIRHIRKNNPKVIGFDGFFSVRRDSAVDALLVDRLKESNNFIMACYLTGKNELTGKFDSLETSDPYFNSGNSGYVNLGGANPEISTVRTFSPREVFKGRTLYPLSVSLIKRFDPPAFSNLMKRNNNREVINYRGNKNAYITFDASEIFDSATDLTIIKNKIVLMGYIGESFQSPPDLEDIYYTPMNSELSGRSRPDMYGVVIHANIVSMILNGNYINVMPAWLCILYSFIFCYFYIVFITWLNARNPLLFNVVFPVFLLVLNVLIIYIFFMIYKYWNYSINSGYFLAPLLLYKTFLTYYERVLLVINRRIKIKSVFLPKK
ncbi:MAG: CHASE2 domain-containing protein [Bacteroidales bacterium]|nr:CHASE2 domain-containing protein [Bacteroidales bacterium]